MLETRRSFIKKAALASVSPMVLGCNEVQKKSRPSGRITMGFIGVGRRGGNLLKTAINYDVQVLAVCDADTNRRENAKNIVDEFYKRFPEKGTAGCKAYNDFREIIERDDIDAVCIATPDHWHAYAAVAALKSGKDVYCEKPLTYNINEAIAIMKAVKANDRVFQTGSQQRSGSEFRVACELVRNGVIGKISHVDCSFGGPAGPCDLPEESAEPGLDWDMWIGPAQMRSYNSILSPRGIHKHFPKWRNYKEFGGGSVCDWGAHHIDIAQWGLGMDDSGPVEVSPAKDGPTGTGGVLKYANGIYITHKGKGYGIQFFGDRGEVKVNRGRFELILDGKRVAGHDKNDRTSSLEREVILAERKYLKDARVKLYNSKNHFSDFLECMVSRKKPVANEIIGARSVICCHLLNQVYYNNQKIDWDPQKIAFAKGTGNPKWLTRNYRSPWRV
ncbi:MAG: Gfo/Idh/MocA family oxidoreductase [Planctomycetes bacterium]|nr:Gfo/Idh/MocA family oxidoreductase [Planctomycetota bacterium]